MFCKFTYRNKETIFTTKTQQNEDNSANFRKQRQS